MRRVLAVAAVLGAVLSAGAVHAQSAQIDVAKAEGLFNQGVRLLEQKKFADACVMLEESRKLSVGLGVTLYLADCYENVGKTASALALFREGEKLAQERKDARQQIARDRAERLEKVVPRLLLRVTPEVAAAKQQVILDNRRTETKEWGLAIAVDPGTHKVRSMAEDGNSWESEVTVPAGGTVSLDIPLLRPRAAPAPATQPAPAVAPAPTPAPAPAPTPESPPESPGKTQRTAGIVVGSVGVVGLGLGLFFGLHAKSKQDESNQAGVGYCNADDKCGQAGLDLRQSAEGSATASTVFFVLGGLATAGGAVLYFTAPKAKGAKATTGLTVAPTLGGVAARATF